MALESMRVGGGRCPPIIVGLLLLLCFLLTCNWWSISTENTELLLQIDQLHEEIRISLEERQKCETLAVNCDFRYKQSEDTIASLHLRESEMKKNIDELKKSLAFCNNELESLKHLDATRNATLDVLRLDNGKINDQLNVKREETQKLQADLEKIKLELNNLNRTCISKVAHLVQDQDQNNSKYLGNNNGEENGDTAGEIDDDQQVLQPVKHRSPSPDNLDPVLNFVARGSQATAKPNKSYD